MTISVCVCVFFIERTFTQALSVSQSVSQVLLHLFTHAMLGLFVFMVGAQSSSCYIRSYQMPLAVIEEFFVTRNFCGIRFYDWNLKS